MHLGGVEQPAAGLFEVNQDEFTPGERDQIVLLGHKRDIATLEAENATLRETNAALREHLIILNVLRRRIRTLEEAAPEAPGEVDGAAE